MLSNNKDLGQTIYEKYVSEVSYADDLAAKVREKLDELEDDAEVYDSQLDDEDKDVLAIIRDSIEEDSETIVSEYLDDNNLDLNNDNKIQVVCEVQTLLSKHIGLDDEFQYNPEVNIQTLMLDAVLEGRYIGGVVYPQK